MTAAPDQKPPLWQRLTHAFTGSGASESLSVSDYHQPEAVGVEVAGLVKTFADQPVLRGIDLDIHAGETFCIIGPSGTGKSVLLRHLAGLVAPDAGHVSYRTADGNAPRLGMVFQSSALFNSLTVADNIALWLREKQVLPEAQIAQVVVDKLALVGLQGTQQLPVAQLSGGMRKRVAIARALALNPGLLLYDEPTAELDPVTTDELARVILDLRQNVTMTSIIVTHDLNFALYLADRVAMMHDGRIVEIGTPEAIRQSTNPLVRNFIYTTTKGIKGA